jgi:hypothetical protein
VAALSEIPAGQVPMADTVALPAAPSMAAVPFTRSFAATLAMGVAAAPAGTVAVSALGTMLAVT